VEGTRGQSWASVHTSLEGKAEEAITTVRRAIGNWTGNSADGYVKSWEWRKLRLHRTDERNQSGPRGLIRNPKFARIILVLGMLRVQTPVQLATAGSGSPIETTNRMAQRTKSVREAREAVLRIGAKTQPQHDSSQQHESLAISPEVTIPVKPRNEWVPLVPQTGNWGAGSTSARAGA